MRHFQPLLTRSACEVEQVGARADERHQRHHQFFADRVNRRVGHLGEQLLEVGVQQLGLRRQRRDWRVGAHGAHGLLAGLGHGREQELDVFLRVAKGLLTVEQRHVGLGRGRLHVRHVLEQHLGAVQPLPVGVLGGQFFLQVLVGDDAVLLEVDEQHLARLQAPLGGDGLLGEVQHAHFRRQHDEAVTGDEITGGTQAVAVQRSADLAAVGEGDCRRSIPRLHQGGVVLVEGAAVFIHQRVAGPRFRDHHHHGVRQRVTGELQQLQRVVEAGAIRLAFIRDRPQLLHVGAEQVGAHGGITRRHPVVVAAQRVDLAVVADHPVRVGERPGREGVGREPLVHQRQSRRHLVVLEVGIIVAQVHAQHETLVDDGFGRHGHDIVARGIRVADRGHAVRHNLAHDIELAREAERVGVLEVGAAGHEHLAVEGFGRLDRLTQHGRVDRHVAPAQHFKVFFCRRLGKDVLDALAHGRVARHEHEAHAIVARCRQFETEALCFAREEVVRDLDQDASAVTGLRVRAHRTAMFQIFQDAQAVRNDAVALHVVDVGDHADTAGIVLVGRIVQTGFGGQSGLGQSLGACCRVVCHVRPSLPVAPEPVRSGWDQMHQMSNRFTSFSGAAGQGAGGVVEMAAPCCRLVRCVCLDYPVRTILALALPLWSLLGSALACTFLRAFETVAFPQGQADRACIAGFPFRSHFDDVSDLSGWSA